MAGHLLNITITANETLKDANITILNSTYVMSINGTVANASVNVYQNSTEGVVMLNVTGPFGEFCRTKCLQMQYSNELIQSCLFQYLSKVAL